jgi:hypothetical protein
MDRKEECLFTLITWLWISIPFKHPNSWSKIWFTLKCIWKLESSRWNLILNGSFSSISLQKIKTDCLRPKLAVPIWEKKRVIWFWIWPPMIEWTLRLCISRRSKCLCVQFKIQMTELWTLEEPIPIIWTLEEPIPRN